MFQLFVTTNRNLKLLSQINKDSETTDEARLKELSTRLEASSFSIRFSKELIRLITLTKLYKDIGL